MRRIFEGIFGDHGEPAEHGGEGTLRRTALQIGAVFLFFLVLAFVLRHQGFGSEMVYDSGGLISQNAAKFEAHDAVGIMSVVPARPLFMLSFYFNYLLTGMDPYYFRLTNTMILAASGAALTLLIFVIFTLPGVHVPGTRSRKRLVAFFAGLLFVVHPVQNLVVLYVWQREAIMACFFYYAALAVYLSARAGRFQRPIAPYVCVSVLFFAGLLSKENVVTLPVVMVLAELVFFRRGVAQIVRRAGAIALMVVPPLAAYVLIPSLLHGADSAHAGSILERLTNHYNFAGHSPSAVVLTASRVIFSYLVMVIAPSAGGLEFIRAELVSRSLVDPLSTLSAVSGVILLMGISIWVRSTRPAVAFGILFYLVSLVPESLLIPHYLFFGYRAILPMAGVLLILGYGVLVLYYPCSTERSAGLLNASLAALVAVAVIHMGAINVSHAKLWSPTQFWKVPTEKLPPYSENVEPVPYLDISVNYLVLLNTSGKHAETMDLFLRIAGGYPVFGPYPGSRKPHNLGTDEIERATARFEERFKDKPWRVASALLCFGNSLVSTGKYVEAVAPYRKALKYSPYDIPVYLNLGALLEYSGRVTEAMEEYGKAIAVDPNAVAAYVSLGTALQKVGNMEGAVELFSKAVEVDPNYAPAHYHLANALALFGNSLESIEHYRKAVSIDPNIAEAHHNLGRGLAAFGDFSAATRHYEKAIKLSPGQAILHNDLGIALEYQGRTTEAIEHYRKATQSEPRLIVAWNMLGLALRKVGRSREAIRCLKNAAEIDPGSAETHHNLGIVLAGAGFTDEAVKHYRKALDIDPGLTTANVNLGLALESSGNLREAVLSYKKALERDSDLVIARERLAGVLEQTGKLDEALKLYRVAAGAHPQSLEVQYRFAQCLLRNGELKESIARFKKALELNPDFIEAHAGLAVALMKTGEIPEAIVTLGKALSLNDENAALFNALGTAFARMGEHGEAAKQFQRALSVDPNHSETGGRH